MTPEMEGRKRADLDVAEDAAARAQEVRRGLADLEAAIATARKPRTPVDVAEAARRPEELAFLRGQAERLEHIATAYRARHA